MKLIFSLLILSIFTGCDLFETRTPEEPLQPRSNFQLAVTPEILISNLINSLQDKDVESYISCFTDSSFSHEKFSFSASSAALSQFPFLSDNWDKNDERQYFNRMVSSVDNGLPVLLDLSNSSTSPLGDSIIYTASYTLQVPHNNEAIPVNYQGELRFNMIVDSRLIWTIYFWQDTKNSDTPSWSELKGRFY